MKHYEKRSERLLRSEEMLLPLLLLLRRKDKPINILMKPTEELIKSSIDTSNFPHEKAKSELNFCNFLEVWFVILPMIPIGQSGT